VSAQDTNSDSQYSAFTDRLTVSKNLTANIGETRAMLIIFNLDRLDYWMKNKQERAIIINKLKSLDSGYTLVDSFVKEDVFPSKNSTYIHPDMDYVLNQIMKQNIPKDASIYQGMLDQMKSALGFPADDINSPGFRDHPAYFGDAMRAYFTNSTVNEKEKIFTSETLNWLYAPEGYLSDYFENRNKSQFTEEEKKILQRPPGYDFEDFFRFLEFWLTTTAAGSAAAQQYEVAIPLVVGRIALLARPIITPFINLLKKPVAKIAKTAQPAFEEVLKIFPKQKYTIKSGSNVTERILEPPGEISEFPTVVSKFKPSETVSETKVSSYQVGLQSYTNNSQLNQTKKAATLVPNSANSIRRDLVTGDIIGSFSKDESEKAIKDLGVEGLIDLQNDLLMIKFYFPHDSLYSYNVPKEYLQVVSKFQKTLFEEGRLLRISSPEDKILYDPILKKQVPVRVIDDNGKSVIVFSSHSQGKDDLITLTTEINKIYLKEMLPLRKTASFNKDYVQESAVRYLSRKYIREEYKADLNNKPVIDFINAHYYGDSSGLKTKSDFTADLWDRLGQTLTRGIRQNKLYKSFSDQEINNIVDSTLSEIVSVTGEQGLEKRIFFNNKNLNDLFIDRIKRWDDALSTGNATSAVRRQLKLQDSKLFSLIEKYAKDTPIKNPSDYKIFGNKYEQIWNNPFSEWKTGATYDEVMVYFGQK